MAKTGNQLLVEALQHAIDSAIGNIVYHKNIKPKQQALFVKNGYIKKIIKGIRGQIYFQLYFGLIKKKYSGI